MKTQKIPLLWLFCLILVFCAYSLTAQNTDPFSIAKYEQIVPAFAGKPAVKAKMEISLSLTDTKDTKLAKLINSVLYDGLTPKQYAEKVINKEKSEYQKEMAENPDMPEWAGNWEYGETHTVTVKGSYAIIARSISTYYGGAHPYTGVMYFVINTKTPEFILIDNIAAGANMSKLIDIAMRELKSYLKSIDFYDEDYFDGKIKINNFFPAKDGLCIEWNPYEVAPYAVGPVNIVIKWKEAEGLLNSKGKALAKAFK